MEEEYYRQIELQEKLAADEKRREEMRESMERTLMMQEEDYIRKYFARVKKIEMVKEKSERYAMKREEDYLKWVLNEQRRQQILREKVELKRMRSEEESQRRMTIAIQKEKMKLEERLKREEIQREHAERQMMEAEETYQRWLVTEAVRLNEMALKEQYNHDLAVAKIERHAMQLEEERQRTFEMNVWRRYQKSKMLWQRVEEERRLNELTTMQKEEEYQKLVEHKNRISALEKRNSDRERVLMQAEDMQSKMYSLNQSIGSHMLNIRKFERAIQRNTNVIQEVHDPFSIVRSMTDDLSKHTSEIKNSYQVRYNQNRKHFTAGEYSKELVEDTTLEEETKSIATSNRQEVEESKSQHSIKSSRGLDLQGSGNLSRPTPSPSDDDLKREDSVALGNDTATIRDVRKHSVDAGMSDNDSDFMDAKEFVLNTEIENEAEAKLGDSASGNFVPKTPNLPRDFDRMQMTDLEELNLMSGSISEKRKKYEKVRQEARKYIEGISFGAETPGTHVTPPKASMMWKC